MDLEERLGRLAEAARYDLACACGTKDNDDHRRRGEDGQWKYPLTAVSGGRSVMLKTLLSNHCANRCRYCPYRADNDVPRLSLTPEETANSFIEWQRRRSLIGLFLSSGVTGTPDATMDRLVATATLLRRRYRYRGYIHLKIIPGCSDAALEAALRVASAVSLNIEAPSAEHAARLGPDKNYEQDILRPMRKIAALTAKGAPYAKVCQTSQFVVGAAGECDSEIVSRLAELYRDYALSRVYFSAYQRGLGSPELPGESQPAPDPFKREHRLYQVDFLFRQYKFKPEEIPFASGGFLALDKDPKLAWAEGHPEFFPVRLKSASREQLLRVPGLGPVTVRRLLKDRRSGGLPARRDFGLPAARWRQAKAYLIWE